MIHIDIDPNIAKIGPFLLAWHGLFSVVGIYLGLWVPCRLLVKDRVTDGDTFYTVGMWAVAGGIVGALLLWLYRRLPRPGMNFWVFFLGYSLIRVAIGFFRQDTVVAWGLGQAQLIGVLSIPVALAMLALLWRDAGRREPAPAAEAEAPR